MEALSSLAPTTFSPFLEKFKSYGVGGRQRTGVGGSLPRPLYTVPREDWDNPTSSRLLLTLDWASQAPDL